MNSPTANPVRILLADDSRTQAAVMKLHLEKKGYAVEVANDGVEAVEKIYGTHPDLVVSDVEMPILTGYQVCRLVKDDPMTRNTPIILLTSLREKKDSFWGYKSGADHYLTKGARPEEVADAIRKFIHDRGMTGSPKKQAVEGATVDVMGRIIRMLDWSLFLSTVHNEIGQLVSRIEHFNATVFSLLALASRVIEFDLGGVLLFDKGIARLLLYAPAGLTIGDERLFAEWARAEGHGFNKGDLSLRIDYPEGVSARKSPVASYPDQEAISLPLMRGDEIDGTIRLVLPAGKEPSEPTMELFRLLASHGNLVLQYALLFAEKQTQAVTDGLTGLYNHRYFQECIRNQLARSQRNNEPFSLIMADIDHFKVFNDTYGHQQGDVILRTLARIMKECLREVDVVSRYGGEEFAIICPEASLENALMIAERIRKTVEETTFEGPSGPLSVTLSLGYASAPEDGCKSGAELIAKADRSLYRAKERGRNRSEHVA